MGLITASRPPTNTSRSSIATSFLESDNSFEVIEKAFDQFDCFQPFERITLAYSTSSIDMPNTASLRATGFSFGAAHPGSASPGRMNSFNGGSPYALLGGGDLALSYLLLLANTYGVRSPRFVNLAEFCLSKRLFPALCESLSTWVQRSCPHEWNFGDVRSIRLHSLPHGCQRRRNYDARYALWSRDGPVPGVHFDIEVNGLLEWKPAISNKWGSVAMDYFRSRAEDEDN